MMRLAPFLSLLIACTGKDEDDDDDGGDTSAGDGLGGLDGTDGSDGSDETPFFEVSGSLGGEEITIRCDPDSPPQHFYSFQIDREDGMTLVRGACANDTGTGPVGVDISVYSDGPTAGTTCEASVLSVTVWSNVGSFWDCSTDTVADFELIVPDWSDNDDGSLTWGGSFEVEGSSSSMGAVELEGSFLLVAPAQQGAAATAERP